MSNTSIKKRDLKTMTKDAHKQGSQSADLSKPSNATPNSKGMLGKKGSSSAELEDENQIRKAQIKKSKSEGFEVEQRSEEQPNATTFESGPSQEHSN